MEKKSSTQNSITQNLLGLSTKLQETIAKNPTNTIVLRNSELPQFNLYQKIQIVKLPPKFRKNFDGRKIWKKLLSPIKNQGTCGSCWAFATSSVLADRFNILSQGKYNLNLSPAKMILCDWGGAEVDVFENTSSDRKNLNLMTQANIDNIDKSACFGNTLEDAGRFLYITGTNTESCVPYTKGVGNEREFQSIGNYNQKYELPLCIGVTAINSDMCSNFTYEESTGQERGQPARFYKCYHYYGIYGTKDYDSRGNSEQIQVEIFKWGPVATGFKVYSDFYTFDAKNDVYQWDKKSPLVGGHAVSIIGWGTTKRGLKYWIVRNSWGVKWGDGGFFKIKRGINECGIEQSVMGMVPHYFFKPGSRPYEPPLNFIIANKNGYENMQKTKAKFDQTTTRGGGVDPTTGYSRRTMIRYPWLDTKRPVPLNQLPNWVDFIAGNPTNSLETLLAGDAESSTKKTGYTILWIILGAIGLAVIISLIIIV